MVITFNGYWSAALASETPKNAKQSSTRTILLITVHLQQVGIMVHSSLRSEHTMSGKKSYHANRELSIQKRFPFSRPLSYGQLLMPCFILNRKYLSNETFIHFAQTAFFVKELCLGGSTGYAFMMAAVFPMSMRQTTPSSSA